jgi:phosphosulfolactate synthase (CoM biosynthesis protein A)
MVEKKYSEYAFNFLKIFELPPKPRKIGITEIRGPYYEAFTTNQLESLLKDWGEYIDGFKFAGGTQRLLKRNTVKKFIKICHDYDVYVNTGGFIERVIIQSLDDVEKYLDECKALEFDVVEISSGMFSSPQDFDIKDQIEIVKLVKNMGMLPKPEITIISGAGAGTKVLDYEKETETKSINQLIKEGEDFLKSGAYMLMVESEGITEGLPPEKWRKDVVITLVKKFGIEKLMFEISPEDDEARKTFKWYIKNIDRWVNLMMNSKNIVEYNAWRLGLWGDRDIWKGKRISYK